jgi:hypothetical protein
LQTDQQATEGLFKKFIAGQGQAKNDSEHDRYSVANQHAPHADADCDPETVVFETRE